MKRMTRWGVGPSLISAPLGVAVIAAVATHWWPERFSIWFVPYPVLAAIGIVMVVAGVPIFILSFRAITNAFAEGRLVTDGTYAICRNPLYANWIILLLPAIALLCNSWLMLLAPAVLYITTRLRIHHEEAYLEERFRQEFIEYRQRTNAIFPALCRKPVRHD